MKILTYKAFPQQAMTIRQRVFVEEQGFVDEFDETDCVAVHLLAYDQNDLSVGTCRVFSGKEEGTCLLGRLAVLKEHRGKGVGTALLGAAEDYARSVGALRLALHSQYSASGFYRACGYREKGAPDYEQGCPHVWMEKLL